MGVNDKNQGIPSVESKVFFLSFKNISRQRAVSLPGLPFDAVSLTCITGGFLGHDKTDQGSPGVGFASYLGLS